MSTVDPNETLKQKIFRIWMENPHVSPKEVSRKLVLLENQAIINGLSPEHIAAKIKLFHTDHGQTIRNYLSQFRCTCKNGLPQKAHNRLPHKRVFHWVVSRDLLLESLQNFSGMSDATNFKVLGWIPVKNRNGMLVFREKEIHPFFRSKKKGDGLFNPVQPVSHLGSVHWYQDGRVIMYLKGEVSLANAKKLFYHAFWFLSERQKYELTIGRLVEKEKHWVFETGQPMPRFEIRQFERSHGIRIFVDGSHPTALEVRETVPFWIDELKESTAALAVQIREHLALIQDYRKEASASIKLAESVTELVNVLKKNMGQKGGD